MSLSKKNSHKKSFSEMGLLKINDEEIKKKPRRKWNQLKTIVRSISLIRSPEVKKIKDAVKFKKQYKNKLKIKNK